MCTQENPLKQTVEHVVGDVSTVWLINTLSGCLLSAGNPKEQHQAALSTCMGIGWMGRPVAGALDTGPSGRVQEAGGGVRSMRVPGEEPVGGTITKPAMFRNHLH